MNAQDLKNSILQLAIQGKLVEQREEEGTAKELLEQIKVEKEKLIKEGKIKKEKKLPEITEDEVLFDIPESWEWARLLNIADMYTGNSIPKNVKDNKYSKVKEGYDYIGTKDVGFDYTIDYDNGIKIPFEEEKFRNSFKDSILMCIEGGSAGRKIGILDKTVCFGNKLCSFNLIYGEPRFLYYYLQSPMFYQAFRDEMTGIIGGVSITKLKSIVIPLPPLEEQKRIVAKIEELMPYVDKYDIAYSEVEELNKKFPEDMQKSILQYAIQGKLVKQREEDGTAEELYKQIQEEKKKLIKEGKIKKTKAFPEITEDEIPFDIPDNWKWVRLSDVTHNWGQKKPDKTFDYIDVGSIDNINGSLSEEENLIDQKDAPSRARKIVKEGSVIYSTVRPYLLNICIIDKEFKHEPIASTAFAVLHPIKGKRWQGPRTWENILESARITGI
jgi:type I restriction enzyme S subunit